GGAEPGRPGAAEAQAAGAPRGLAQLAVLAAAAVVTGRLPLFAVGRLLAVDAQPYAGHGIAARLRDLRIAFLAMLQPRTLPEPGARALDRVRHGGVDLVLHRAVASPARSHGQPPRTCQVRVQGSPRRREPVPRGARLGHRRRPPRRGPGR